MAIHLQDQDLNELRILANSTDKTTARRAKILLLAANGNDTQQISQILGVSERTIRYVMQQFKTDGAASLQRQSPHGRRRMTSAQQKATLTELINQSPQGFGIPKDKWILTDIVAVAKRECVIENVSVYTIRREIIRCIDEQPELCEHLHVNQQKQPGAPAGNRNAMKHGAYSDDKLSADEESQVAKLTKCLLDDFPETDEAGKKQIQTIAQCYIRMNRANNLSGADAMMRFDRKLRKAIEKLKTKGQDDSPNAEPQITPAEWATDLLERYRQWEAQQK